MNSDDWFQKLSSLNPGFLNLIYNSPVKVKDAPSKHPHVVLEVKSYNWDEAIKKAKSKEEKDKLKPFEETFKKMDEMLGKMQNYGLNQGTDVEVLGCLLFNGESPLETTIRKINTIISDNNYGKKHPIRVIHYSSSLCPSILQKLEQKKTMEIEAAKAKLEIDKAKKATEEATKQISKNIAFEYK